jgi:hypothetical protein
MAAFTFDTASMERVGPWFDLFVGTEGRVSDLYAAYNTHGARKIVLCAGATLSADLTIAANDVYIWSPFQATALNLGAKKITVTGARVHLAGFRLDGAGAGIVVDTSGEAWFERIAVQNATSHGIHLLSSQNDAVIDRCRLFQNGGDGLRLTVGSHARMENSLSYGNTGYGVNDLTNSSILVGNRIAANTAGQINGTPSVNTGNKTT